MTLMFDDMQADLVRRGVFAPDATWEVLGGGRSNDVWRVGGTFVCKLYRPDENPLFANSAALEFAALKAVAGVGLAPEPVDLVSGAFGDVVVYCFEEGAPWDGDFAGVGAVLRRLHGGKVAGDWPDAPASVGALVEEAMGILAGLPAETQKGLLPARPEVAEGELRPMALLHGDVVPANLVRGREGLRLIDWQSPKWGDPVLDVAYFLSPAMHIVNGHPPPTPAQHLAFWEAYEDLEAQARFEWLAPLFHWRMACYCAWKVQSGDGDYEAGLNAELAAIG